MHSGTGTKLGEGCVRNRGPHKQAVLLCVRCFSYALMNDCRRGGPAGTAISMQAARTRAGSQPRSDPRPLSLYRPSLCTLPPRWPRPLWHRPPRTATPAMACSQRYPTSPPSTTTPTYPSTPPWICTPTTSTVIDTPPTQHHLHPCCALFPRTAPTTALDLHPNHINRLLTPTQTKPSPFLPPEDEWERFCSEARSSLRRQQHA